MFILNRIRNSRENVANVNAKALLLPLFKALLLGTRFRKNPDKNNRGYECIKFSSADGCQLQGYVYKPQSGAARGTLIMCHGWTGNCWNLHKDAERLANRHDLNVLTFDHRCHGLSSSNHVNSFGYMEGLDVSAAIDHALLLGFKAPFICRGESLGALGIQSALYREQRIHAALLLSCPASPNVAIDTIFEQPGKMSNKLDSPLKKMGLESKELLNSFYGFNVIDRGDISLLPSKPIRAKTLYVMGRNDFYGCHRTKKSFHRWIGVKSEQKIPRDTEKETMLWWYELDAGHDVYKNPLNRQEFEKVEDSFFRTVLGETPKLAHADTRQTVVKITEQGYVGQDWNEHFYQSRTFNIKFEKKFEKTPILHTSIVKLDARAGNDKIMRYHCEIINLDSKGAIIKVQTWNSNLLAGVKVQWTAFGE